MPFLRFSRDKRGYEHAYLIHTVSDRRGRTRPRILYWFRTPPGVKVGREMLDDQIVRALESQYPEVTFDWATLRKTPMASPEPEPWRERRRAQRAARHVREADDEETETAAAEETPIEPDSRGLSTPGAADVRSEDLEPAVADLELASVPEGADADVSALAPSPVPGGIPLRRGRGRRGRSGRRDRRSAGR